MQIVVFSAANINAMFSLFSYALTDLGHALGEKLLLFSRKLFDYLSSCHLPKLPDSIRYEYE